METMLNLIKLVALFWGVCFLVACFKEKKHISSKFYLLTRLSVFEKVFYGTILLVLFCKTW